MIQAQVAVETLQKALQARGLGQGKAFRRHCGRLTNAAAYRDLEDIHDEIRAKHPLTWEDLAEQEAA